MANSGYKNWLTLKKYVNGVATEETKTNAPNDPDYIAPVLDTSICPPTSNSCPSLDTPISNISANAEGVDQTINLNNHFVDLDGDTLTYTATSSNTNSVTVSVASNILTLSFSSTAGSSIISVTASDGTCSANESFSVTVTEVATACVTGLSQLLGLYNGATSDEACARSAGNAVNAIYANGTSITNSTNFYSTIDGCTTYPSGFLSDGTDWIQLNSFGIKVDSGLCVVPPPPCTIDCESGAQILNESSTSYGSYPDQVICSTVPTEVTLFWDAKGRPNRYTVYEGSAIVYNSGWVGNADYPGPWGSTLSTSTTGNSSITFSGTADRKIVVEHGGASPNGEADSAEFTLVCPAPPTITYYYLSVRQCNDWDGNGALTDRYIRSTTDIRDWTHVSIPRYYGDTGAIYEVYGTASQTQLEESYNNPPTGSDPSVDIDSHAPSVGFTVAQLQKTSC